jgi:hypothetical protein
MANPEQFEIKPSRAGAPAANDLSLLGIAQPDKSGFGNSDNNDSSDLFGSIGSRTMRGIGAGATLYMNGLAGFHRELANMADLKQLQQVNPSRWADTITWNERSLGSVRYELQQNRAAGSWRLQGEDHALERIGARGIAKGVAIGVAALGANMALDVTVFQDTPRTWVSEMADVVGMPLIGIAPINPYAKGAAMVGLHTAGRLYDKYHDKLGWSKF